MPKIAVPTRTQVLPSSMATRKSFDIPMESWVSFGWDFDGLVAEAAQLAEVGPRCLGVFGPGRDGHQADGFDGGELAHGVEQGGEIFGGDSVLRFLVAQLHFDEQGKTLVASLCSGIEALGDLERVNGVDGVEELGGLVGLVRLQRSDEVEGGVGQMPAARATSARTPGRGFRRRGGGRLRRLRESPRQDVLC